MLRDIAMDQSACVLITSAENFQRGPFTILDNTPLYVLLLSSRVVCRLSSKSVWEARNVRTTFTPDLINSITSWQCDLLYYAATRISEKRSRSVARLGNCYALDDAVIRNLATWKLRMKKGNFSTPRKIRREKENL